MQRLNIFSIWESQRRGPKNSIICFPLSLYHTCLNCQCISYARKRFSQKEEDKLDVGHFGVIQQFRASFFRFSEGYIVPEKQFWTMEKCSSISAWGWYLSSMKSVWCIVILVNYAGIFIFIFHFWDGEYVRVSVV